MAPPSTSVRPDPAPAAKPGPRPPRRAPAFLPRMAIELLVVFIGVYAAVVASEYQQERERAARREQIRAALVREIEGVTDRTRRVGTWAPQAADALDSLIAAGARPPLEPMIEPVRVQSHVWEATLQSGGIDLFDVPTVLALSGFYNELNAGFEQLAQLRDLSETVLIPNLGAGPAEFYDPETGALRPKYRWYPAGLRRLGALAGEITVLGDSLVAELEAAP